MTERNLKLVKAENGHCPVPVSRNGEAAPPAPRLVPHNLQIIEPESEPKTETEAQVEFDADQPTLTEAEAAEAARFKALVADRAARQAMLYRIMAELEELDEISPAA